MPIGNSIGGWAHSDEDGANTFAVHLKNVLQPNPASSAFVFILPTIRSDAQLQNESIEFRPNKIANTIKMHLNLKKSY